MVKIHHDTLGDFEGDTLKDARAKLKKAEREEKARDAKRQLDYDQARLLATALAYRVLEKKVKGEELPGELYPAGNTYSPVQVTRDGEKYGSDHYRYHCVGGTVVNSHHGYRLIGTVVGNAGFPVVVFFEPWDHLDDPTFRDCLAVAVKGDSIAFVPVPGVSPEDFKPVVML